MKVKTNKESFMNCRKILIPFMLSTRNYKKTIIRCLNNTQEFWVNCNAVIMVKVVKHKYLNFSNNWSWLMQRFNNFMKRFRKKMITLTKLRQNYRTMLKSMSIIKIWLRLLTSCIMKCKYVWVKLSIRIN